MTAIFFTYIHIRESKGLWIEKRDPIASIENCFILFNICTFYNEEVALTYLWQNYPCFFNTSCTDSKRHCKMAAALVALI